MIPQIIGAFELLSHGMTVFKILNNGDKPEAISSQEITSLLSSSTENLKEIILADNDRLIEKLERDQMEILASRLNNLELLLRMQDEERLFSYLLTTQESVDYARNRYLEGKQIWFTPYLIGRSVVLASFSFLGNIDEKSIKALKSELKVEIHKLLNEMTLLFIKHNIPIPWDKIEAILTLQEDGLSQLLEHLQNTHMMIEHDSDEPDASQETPSINPKFSVDWFKSRIGTYHPNIYIKDEIPVQKLMNATQKMKITEEVYLLYDNTLFGGARDGVCLTKNMLCWHNIGENPDMISFKEIHSLSVESQGIVVNSKRIAINISPNTVIPQLKSIICELAGID